MKIALETGTRYSSGSTRVPRQGPLHLYERVCMELVYVTTADDYEYEGLLWSPSTPGNPRLGAVLVHGWSYWYDPRIRSRGFCGKYIAAIGASLASIGVPSLFTLNRGFHAPEFFNDCSLDFEAAIDFLVHKGCEGIVLVGHSLGGAKCAYYAGEIGHPRLRGVALISAIPSSYNFQTPEKQKLIAQARILVASGQKHQITPCQEGKTVSLHEPATTLRNLDDGYRGTTLDAASKIILPLLSLAAERERGWFQVVTKGIREAAVHASSVDADIIAGARDHYYKGYETILAERISSWAQRVLLP